jgi:hypothetical protein
MRSCNISNGWREDPRTAQSWRTVQGMALQQAMRRASFPGTLPRGPEQQHSSSMMTTMDRALRRCTCSTAPQPLRTSPLSHRPPPPRFPLDPSIHREGNRSRMEPRLPLLLRRLQRAQELGCSPDRWAGQGGAERQALADVVLSLNRLIGHDELFFLKTVLFRSRLFLTREIAQNNPIFVACTN